MAQGRRVRLVVRRIEPWTVLKFSVLLYITMYLVILVAGMVLWAAASATGVRTNIEKFIGELIASDNFTLLGPTVAKASILGGAVLVVMGTGANVLLTVLYNLISDVVGGVVVVFEERPGRRRGMRLREPGEPLPALQPSQGRRRTMRSRAPREQSSGADLPPPPPEHAHPEPAQNPEPSQEPGRMETAEVSLPGE